MNVDAKAPERVWTMSGGGPQRAGAFVEPVRLASKPARELTVQGSVQSAVVFDVRGNAFVADMAGRVCAFNPDGHLLWERQLEAGTSATPAVDVDRERLFVGTLRGGVCAMRTSDGTVLWQRMIPTKTDPRVLSDLLWVSATRRVVLSSWGGMFHALDADSGESKQTWDAGLASQCAASADSTGSVYFLKATREAGVLLGRVDRDGDQETLHQQPAGDRGGTRAVVSAAPVLMPSLGIVWFVTNADKMAQAHAWSMAEKRILWTRTLPSTVSGTPAVAPDGQLILADAGGAIRALDRKGTPVYEYATNAEYLLSGPVCDAVGRVFAGDPLGVLHTIDRSGKGRPMFEAPRSIQARPSFDPRGNLYVPTADKRVLVFANEAAI